MKKKYTWSRRSDDEFWCGGIHDTIKECIDEATEDMKYRNEDTFALGYAVPYKVTGGYGDYIIQLLQEEAYDEIGEGSESWLDTVTKEQIEDLDNRILKVILEWLKDCQEEPYFHTVEAFDELTIEEAIEKYVERKEE